MRRDRRIGKEAARIWRLLFFAQEVRRLPGTMDQLRRVQAGARSPASTRAQASLHFAGTDNRGRGIDDPYPIASNRITKTHPCVARSPV